MKLDPDSLLVGFIYGVVAAGLVSLAFILDCSGALR
jgi:hypothetical protein